tara:strand:- start:423 stop:1103 length:681 start_codon:yes stop_codon:yes gene_type:complete
LSKRLSDKQKKEIIQYFISGNTVDELSTLFDCTKLTISRNLKRDLGEKKYKDLIKLNKRNNLLTDKKQGNIDLSIKNEIRDSAYLEKTTKEKYSRDKPEEEFAVEVSFTELVPLDYQIESQPQKDLSSIPISDVNFPKMVYMIVDKKIELETKFLKDYPEWNFLSKDDLNRKTIEIYEDIKIAKRFCRNEQKVIKVPNTDVFKLVAPLLILKGISRIVSPDKLIAL